ncbi:MAG TPA: 2-C-methyl-D-erythritol 2,4-cyclodiphosphate synthase [Puia sp.]|jgi:2-C-methyl-D-erythritol 2,4-cyclodiphosphate synthase|nr:2-C-methyl-D-erythritol 2,4-cyclodiphosphate synthase [Puia sp.]
MAYRIGFGIDFHQLAEGREFWLGGVLIPHDRGALGHSDADVLIHAICDALLGALNLGDIGVHFPNTDAAFKDIDSKILLERSYTLVKEKGWRVVNIDSTVCLEAPKIMKFAPAMRETMAKVLGITADEISIKATTTEKMGYVGRGEGLVAYATVLVEHIRGTMP